MKFLKPILRLTCLAIFLASPFPARAVTALVLDSGKKFKLDPRVEAHFAENDISIVVKRFSEPLSGDMLRQFEFVILPNFAGLQAPWFALRDKLETYFVVERNVAVLRGYVEAGGGLFFAPDLGEAGGGAAVEAFEPLLGPWGVSFTAANARDDTHAWETYSWTTAVTDSPVTKGVKRLFYPTQMGRWDDLYPTPPITLRDGRWTPVVRGMPGSVTARCLRYKDWFAVPGAQDPPVLAAIAEIGNGRVALLAVSPAYTLTHAYNESMKSLGEFTTGLINGTVMEKGDGENPSDGSRLQLNMLKWVAEAGARAGFGGYNAETYAGLPAPEKPPVPKWLLGWTGDSGAQFHKTLIGARTEWSDGKGTVAECAAAAREAGYAILVLTETFEHFDGDRWTGFLEACDEATSDDLVVIAGLDLADACGARYLLFGQSAYPADFMLTPNGKALKETPYMMLGLTPSTAVLARPGSSPLPHEIYKFFSAIAVYTYRDGKLVDNGLPAYEWHVHNRSDPLPFAVHEVYASKDIAVAAKAGHQLFVPADTPRNAAWYLRHGHQHYWEVPSRFLVTSGPIITSLSSTTFAVQNSVPNLVDPFFCVRGEAPITDIRYYADYNLLRRWTPNATEFQGKVALTHAQRTWGYLVVVDAKGRTAISPPLKGGRGHGYDWRCSDHQNWFGGAVNYTGTRLPGGVNIAVPAFGTDEGRGLWPHGGGPRRGENMAPLIEFPFNSPAVTITDATLDQRYWKALWEEVAYDSKASQGTVRSRVYEGRVRYHDFHYQGFYDFTRKRVRPMMLIEVLLRLRRPVVPEGDLFPAIAHAGRHPLCLLPDAHGTGTSNKLTQGTLELPVGACANNLIALSPGLRVNARGQVGFAPPGWNNGALPTGTEWTGRFVSIDAEKQNLATMRQALGVAAKTPFALELDRGKLDGIAYVAYLEAEDFAVCGRIAPWKDMPHALPLRIDGVNWNWPAAVWQPGAEHELVPFGVFEQQGWARLDVARGGAFYAGNVVLADAPNLRIGLLDWTADGISLEMNNTTGHPVTTRLTTPPEIKGRYRLDEEVTIEAGTSVRRKFGSSPRRR